MNDGDFIKIDYEIWIEDSGELYDTTIEELAKEKGIYDPNKIYRSIVVILGETQLFEEINKALKDSKEGDCLEVVVPPEKAYGNRDPKLIKIHSYRELARLDIEPEVGKEVYIRGKLGKIISVTPGRVVVDYNHPLAGKTLKYKIYVRKNITDSNEKALAIIENHYSHVEGFEVQCSENEIIVKVDGKAKLDPSWVYAKPRIIRDFRKYLGNKSIKLYEEYIKIPEKTEEKHTEEKHTAESTSTTESGSISQNGTDTAESPKE